LFIPPGFGTVAPYFTAQGADRFVAFLVGGLGGREILRTLWPDGTIANAQVRLGTSTVMVSEATEAYPATRGAYYLFVENAGASMKAALAAGASLEMEVGDMPYGDRQGGIRDAWGNIWWISQRLIEGPYT
jgi:PhnB protein